VSTSIVIIVSATIETNVLEGAEEVWGVGRGCPPPTWHRVCGGGCAPSPEKFWNFYIKMVSCAFWVAISYRLATPLRIWPTCGIEYFAI